MLCLLCFREEPSGIFRRTLTIMLMIMMEESRVMYESDITAVGETAKKKIAFMRSNLRGFFLMSVMAGVYIGIGSLFMGVIGSGLNAAGSPATKLVNGVIFSVGLCMVVLCGAELFTGSNFVMAAGAMTKSIRWKDAGQFWILCWLGNFAGSFLTAVLFTFTGIAKNSEVGRYMAESVALPKMTGTPLNLFAKGILCNILVCAAIWGCSRLKSEGAKFAMCFCCVTPFVACGFEHCVANMTFLPVAFMNAGNTALPAAGLIYNLLIVTLGNMTGGILFVALPYCLTAGAVRK